MPMNKKVEIHNSAIHGKAWRAKEDIPNGEWLWEEGPVDEKAFIVHVDELKTWPKDAQDRFHSLAYQYDEKHLRSPYGKDTVAPEETLIAYYVNHCCDGNMWYTDDGNKLVASRDIARGEEITYDYALTQTDPTWSIQNCQCKKPACRSTITGNDYKNKDLQAKYGNHFLPHILKMIEVENARK